MKFKVTDKILDYEGKPMPFDSKGNRDATWRDIIFQSLNNIAPNETLKAEDKSQAYQLTKKIFDHNEPDLSVSERAFTLERIKKVYASPLVCGRAEEVLEEKK